MRVSINTWISLYWMIDETRCPELKHHFNLACWRFPIWNIFIQSLSWHIIWKTHIMSPDLKQELLHSSVRFLTTTNYLIRGVSRSEIIESCSLPREQVQFVLAGITKYYETVSALKFFFTQNGVQWLHAVTFELIRSVVVQMAILIFNMYFWVRNTFSSCFATTQHEMSLNVERKTSINENGKLKNPQISSYHLLGCHPSIC